MPVTRWETPLVFEDGELRITVGSAEEALTWLKHEPDLDSSTRRHAWRACRAAHEGKLPVEQARSAVQRAVESTHH